VHGRVSTSNTLGPAVRRQQRWLLALLVFAATIPLLGPAVPPLNDVPCHIGRYRVMVEAGQGPLALHFGFDWALIGNLGVDLLVYALHPLLDVEPATHLVVALIPALTVAAMLWLGREAQGGLPVAAGFAFPLAYSFPLQMGFINFTLSAALVFGALALWIRLARRWSDVRRAGLFVPIACLVWLCHSFGWAMLGLFVFGAEWVLQRERGRGWWRAAVAAGLLCLPMALPAFAILLGQVQLVGGTADWFRWPLKLIWAMVMLRERWMSYDIASVIVIAMVLIIGIRSRAFSFAPLLGVPALLGFAAFLLLPRVLAGGAYADTRLLPYAVALALLAIRADDFGGRSADLLRAAGLIFYATRLATSTAALALYAHANQVALGALGHIPVGSSVLTLVNQPHLNAWDAPRFEHLGGLAIARRHVFTNGQWAFPGLQLIEPLHPAAAPYDRDPSQLIYRPGSAEPFTDIDATIASFDRGTFDYAWTLGFPKGRVQARDLVPIWSHGPSTLYRVVRVSLPSPAPASLTPLAIPTAPPLKAQ
jgi:hypothetical protein